MLVELGYIHEVPTQNSYNDDPPLLGGSPLFDYTEIMPDIDYLLTEPTVEDIAYKHGKMKKTRANAEHGDIREFVFKNNVLYWWVPGATKDGAKPHASIRFDAKVIMHPEGRNPQLLYAIGISLSQSNQSILVKTNRKVYDFLPQSSKDCDEWFAIFDQALNSINYNDEHSHNFSQFRARNVPENPVDSYSMVRNEKRRSFISLREYDEMYEVRITLPEEFTSTEVMFELYPERTTALDMIWQVIDDYAGGEHPDDFHLLVEDCNWPLYGDSLLLWENKCVRLACTRTNESTASFELVRSNPGDHYSGMPPIMSSTNGSSNVEITVKFPLNQNQLRETKIRIDLNETTVKTIIEQSLQRLVQKSSEIKRDSYMSRNQADLSQEPSDWMMRLAGSDVHLFGDGLLAEFTAVREAFDDFGEVSFQLLWIKNDARKAQKNGFGELDIYRFYAFSYGFMRDIIYRQMLHPHRVNLHGRCAKHLKMKISTDRASLLQILQHRHDQISQRLFYR